MILGLKLDRRLIAATGLDDEAFVFNDSRYLGGDRTVAEALPSFLRRAIDQTQPRAIYVYAPGAEDSGTEGIVRLVETEAAARGIPAKPLTKPDLFHAFGLISLRTRSELREAVLPIWPELDEQTIQRQTPLAEAAAAALVGDLREEWPPV